MENLFYITLKKYGCKNFFSYNLNVRDITSHYITLHYITLHYITLHYITLHYITLHYCCRRPSPNSANTNDRHFLRSCATMVASSKESSESCRSLDTVSFQCMRCLPGRRRLRGSQWSKRRGKRVWCIRVTRPSHVCVARC